MEIYLEKSMKLIGSPIVAYSAQEDLHFLIGEFYGLVEDYEICSIKIMHLPHYSNFKLISEIEPEFKNLYDTFQIIIDNHKKSIRFGPVGNIILTKNRGIGLGSFCMSILIERIQNRYRDYTIIDGSLSAVDAAIKENWLSRDAFYQNLGFVVEVDSDGDGKFSATVDSLKTNYGKISIVSTLELMSKIFEHRSEIERLNRVIDFSEKRFRDRGAVLRKTCIALSISVAVLVVHIIIYTF
ncbi:hypothetical protein OCF84_21185 (plasmid) [Shewanella xiamenensis]|uniref:N-acetyltransferase domain-containing protein n=1 Tax=Shewanella xiamenensis TaxID=332186 RepID=A0ABT6UDR2_9GAMM|nr:hypothetical protein [Shewanella xiamenensis]MDI5832610.1 hypothetical protein [Shewanella xiamenensis]WHF57773.1 hypothetical protein OCF84_21185 [Shewanella xiamenensis]